MSGHGNPRISGLRFSLGSLVAFTWRPEGFWVFQNDGEDPFTPRSDRLINRFENNNYPDREGMADELKADSRFEEKDRISTSDHLIKTWPPYERPVPPAFGVAANEKNQDPKEKEGKFSGKKITGNLKHKLPKDLALHESAYPEEIKTDWFLHEPEHLIYLPEEGERVENRLDRMIQHYILEYTNELRNNAPFLAPLRGEYSPAQWIADFCQRAGELNHDSGLYPEDYRTGEERINKTRQFPCFFNFWWYGENLQINSFNAQADASTEEAAQQISRSVVDAWIGSPPHYANMIRLDTLEYKDLAMLDVGRSGDYYSQVFMGAPLWLLSGCCTWQGTEPWQVLSWKTYENNRYREPFGGEIYFKGKLLYKQETLIGAAIQQQGETYYLLIVTLNSKTIKVLEVEFPFLKTVTHDDFQEVCAYQHDKVITKLQSFFFSTDGTKGITLVIEYNSNFRYIVRYDNRQFTVSKVEITEEVVSNNSYQDAYNFSNTSTITANGRVILVDYLEDELIVTTSESMYQEHSGNGADNSTYNSTPFEYLGNLVDYVEETTNVFGDVYNIASNNVDYLLNGVSLGVGYNREYSRVRHFESHGSYSWVGTHLGVIYVISLVPTVNTDEVIGPTETINDSTPTFVDVRNSVYLTKNQLKLNGQTFTVPFENLYTRQKISGPGIYPIFPNLINFQDYFFKTLLGCCFAQFENEWIFSAVGYQLDSELVPGQLAMEVQSATPVKYFLSSNSEITDHLNTLTKPFLVSVI